MSHELSFRDSITYVLTSACKPGRSVEQHVVEGLRRFFMTTPLFVVWSSSAHRRGAVGATCDDLGSPARMLSPEELDRAMRRVPSVSAERAYDRLTIRLFDDPESDVWALDLVDPGPDGRDWFLVIVARDAGHGAEERAAFFKRYLDGQRQLYAVIKALHAASQLAEWSFDVERLISNGRASLSERIEEAVRMIEQMSRHPTLEIMGLVKRLAIWTMQQMLGTGWRVRRMDAREDRVLVTTLCTYIRAAADQWVQCSEGARDAPSTDPFVGPLHCLADIIEAGPRTRALIQAQEPETHRSADPALRLLRMWTSMHEVARAICKDTLSPDARANAEWETAARTRPELARVITVSFRAADDDAAQLRNWLRLWFCQEIDWDAREGMNRTALWEWRAELAYVLRECLRFLCFGERPDYRVQPAMFSAALRKIVEHHARWGIKVGADYDVQTMLREIGEVPQAEEYHFATGHLQHVLESYIAGHFFCKIRIPSRDGAGGEWTLARLLVARGDADPGEDMENNLLRVFSVAALFHDVGLMLFPRHIKPRSNLYGRDDRLTDLLGGVGQKLADAGASVAEECVRELREGGYVEKASEPLLDRWIEAQRGRGPGKPDHALLGAWYLHRICKDRSPDILRRALRAILLHQTMGSAIDVKEDPAAALLVLCDELFEWDPHTRASPVPNAVGRSLHTMAVDLEPHPSRAGRIRIRGLGVEVLPDGKVVARISRDAVRPQDGWPELEIELKHAEFLDAKVHHYWLTMAQNIGRLHGSSPDFGPSIRLISHVPSWLAKVGGSRRLLERAVNPLGCGALAEALQRWLADDACFEMLDGDRLEVVHITPRNRLLAGEDVRDFLQDIEREVERVLDHPPESARGG